MNRGILKYDAKNAMKEAVVNPYVATIIMGVINLILGIIQELLSLWEGLLNQDAADLEQYTTFFGVLMVFMVISFVVTAIIQFGYYTYCLKVANRDQSMSYGDLFCAMRHFLKVLGLFFMIGLFTFLWTCLFIIPGIIAQYRYSQAVFIMAEDPRKGIMQCIRESKEMMVGHKMEFFILELSFLLWILLSVFTCGLGMIYVCPYMTVTFANYYNSLKPVTTYYQEATVIN